MSHSNLAHPRGFSAYLFRVMTAGLFVILCSAVAAPHAFSDSIKDTTVKRHKPIKNTSFPDIFKSLRNLSIAPSKTRKPAKKRKLVTNAKPQKRLSKKGIPIPRPRPWQSQQRKVAVKKPYVPPPPKPIVKNRSGQVEVSLKGIGRERDPNKASQLQPTKVSAWTKEQIKEAKKRCQIVLATTNVQAEYLKPIGGSGGCGIAVPIKVSSLGAVKINPPATLNCTLTAALYKWVVKDVQPEAVRQFKEPVVSIRNISSYSCRRRNGVEGGRISEHSFGNALDIASVTLASGTKISILNDWGPGGLFNFNKKAAFLSDIHKNACGKFSTVLGPKANKAHANHFHFDLGRDGRYKFCK